MSVRIQNGIIVNADGRRKADLLIQDDRITRIGSELPEADIVLDAQGCYVMPGFIDTHTHLELSPHLFVQDTKAAVLGGTTSVLEFANQHRGGTMEDALADWLKKAAGSSTNYGFHMALAEWTDALEKELPHIGRKGIASFKMYMVYNGLKVDDGEIYGALRALSRYDYLLGVHCENWEVLLRITQELLKRGVVDASGHPLSRPSAVEAEAVARFLRIAQLAQAPAYIVHLSTKEGLEEVRRARARGQEVYVETCMQYLLLNDAKYAQADGVKFIMSPPLRKPEDQAALWEALQAGGIDVIGTDHCSFSMAQKLEHADNFSLVPNGCASIQHRPQLLHTFGVLTGHITPERMVGLLSTNAAALFGLADYGVIREGYAADVVIWDPAIKSTITDTNHAHDCDASIFSGLSVEGAARDVLLGGRQVVRNGKLLCPGIGRYLPRTKSARYRRP